MSDFGGTIKNATWKMCNWQHVFFPASHLYMPIYRVWLQEPRGPGNLPSVHHSTHILSYLYSPCSAFLVLSHLQFSCTAVLKKTENTGWELAQPVQYYYTRIRTQVQIPRAHAKVWALQCSCNPSADSRERTETGQSRDPVD